MNAMIQNALGTVFGVCAIGVTATLLHREFARAPLPVTEEVRHVSDWRQAESGGHILGRPTAPLRVVEFADFECPSCQAIESSVTQLQAKYGGRVAVVYRHFPLTQHSHAYAAANASECAGAQGRFDEYGQVLFGNPDSVQGGRWLTLAILAHVADTAAFATCVREDRFRDRIAADAGLGTRIGVIGTPTFLFRDRMVMGAPGLQRVQSWLDSAVASPR